MIQKINKGFNWIWDNFLVVIFILMVTISFAEVFSRYVFRSPILGSEEIARLLAVWLYFWGAGVAIKYREHIIIDIFYVRVSPRVRNVFNLVGDFLVLIFHAFLIIEGAKHAYIFRGFESHALRFSMSFFFAAIPITCLFTSVFLIQSIFRNIRELRGLRR